ncbi:MAG: metallophosphoesterase, partial [Leucobacter sp.]
PVQSVVALDGWRTIVLDTSVPGAGYGSLDDSQLDFLAAALETPAEHGTVIVMHHPPIAAQTDLLEALALGEEDAKSFWEIVDGTDVRAILSGHYHHPIVEFVHGIPVIVAPGVANIARAFESRSEESALDGFGGASIEITADCVRVVSFERPVSDREVFRFPEETVRLIIDQAGRPH